MREFPERRIENEFLFLSLSLFSTHRWGSTLSEEAQQIAALHQLHYDVEVVVVEADSDECEDVFVLEVAHQLRLLQELHFLLFRRPLAQSFDGNSNFVLWRVDNAALVDLSEGATAQEVRHNDLRREREKRLIKILF